ncbi:hypothetical protein [Parafrankia sp. FMc2]|uniref:hypothetical protein n=1 Tax=Parafrankia sp. FMc2 TaxID=3233196 RepID=UPI0034D3B6C3
MSDLVGQLLGLDEAAFYDLVQADRRGRGAGAAPHPLHDGLRDDDVLDRWLDTIGRMYADIELTIIQTKERIGVARLAQNHTEMYRLKGIRATSLRALEGTKALRREARALVADRNRRQGEEAHCRRQERHRRHRESIPEQAYAIALRRLRDAHPEEFEVLRCEAESALVEVEPGRSLARPVKRCQGFVSAMPPPGA